MAYTCPMHPAVRQEGPGRCPECKMRLVPESEAGTQAGMEAHAHGEATGGWRDYVPIVVVLGMIALVAGVIFWRERATGASWPPRRRDHVHVGNIPPGFFFTWETSDSQKATALPLAHGGGTKTPQAAPQSRRIPRSTAHHERPPKPSPTNASAPR